MTCIENYLLLHNYKKGGAQGTTIKTFEYINSDRTALHGFKQIKDQ